MAKKPSGPKTHTQYLDARTGEFVDKNRAQRMDPAKVVKERVPNPGHGDTGRGKKK